MMTLLKSLSSTLLLSLMVSCSSDSEPQIEELLPFNEIHTSTATLATPTYSGPNKGCISYLKHGEIVLHEGVLQKSYDLKEYNLQFEKDTILLTIGIIYDTEDHYGKDTGEFKREVTYKVIE